MMLLRQEQGDAVLVFNDETVVLTRTAGELVLTGLRFWDEERLAQVPLPFELSDLPLLSL